jgi:hypothetical protein
MSGPKVVHIITREEILDICRGQLARVDAALAEWMRIGRRHACVDQEAITAVSNRRDALAALITAGRFVDLRKQAPIEEAFLRDDIQNRLAKVAAQQSAARMRARREHNAAETLLRTLRVSGRPLNKDLESGLKRGDPQAISAGFALLADNADSPAAAKDLATRLRNDDRLAFSEWLARQPASSEDLAMERIDARLAELSPLIDPDTISRWRGRLDEADVALPARRALLLDGLEIETGRALTEARRRLQLLSNLRLILAEVEAADLTLDNSDADWETMTAAMLEDSLARIRAALEAHRAAKAASSRREAVLKGLASLGYEVTEGMSMFLAKEGRLVLRSATRPDYGVEVSGASSGERMQMRAVAFEVAGRGPDPARDCDAETIWCGHVSKLKERLATIGGGLKIEKALPVGATPLKRVAVEGTTHCEIELPAPRERSLR